MKIQLFSINHKCFSALDYWRCDEHCNNNIEKYSFYLPLKIGYIFGYTTQKIHINVFYVIFISVDGEKKPLQNALHNFICF